MKNFLIVLLILSAGAARSQEYAFKVLVSKGQNTYRSGEDWQPIKVGTTLNQSDEVKVSANGYLGLIHLTGKPLEVKEGGAHKVSALAGRVKATTSVLNKYTDFILSVSDDKPTNLNVTGSVTRGDEEIQVYLPDGKKAVVMNDEVRIVWSRHMKAPAYVVQFSSMFGEELARFTVSDTTLSVNLAKGKFSNEDNIVLKVYSSDDSAIDSEEFVLKKLSVADKNRLNKELDDLKSLMAERTALNYFYLANFYEQNSLLIDAVTSYQNAIRTAPDVQAFRSAFERFIARNALSNPSVITK